MIGPKYVETLAQGLTPLGPAPSASGHRWWPSGLWRVGLSVFQAKKQQGIESARVTHASLQPAKDPVETELGALVEKKSPEKY